ncbi:MAG: hypothetical protein OEY97_11515 [Nitrospirota bacterium]|nr:hypothetical protein [Nitrospirota bacterium]
MAKPIANPRFIARDTAGNDLANGYVLTFHAGTTSPKPVYADAAETAVLPGPATGVNANRSGFVLDSYGEATVFWATGKYTLRVYRADDTLVREIDHFDPGLSDHAVEMENAVANGSFETASAAAATPDGWYLTPGDNFILPARSTADASHGEASLVFTGPGGASSGGSALQQEYMPVTPGRTLELVWQMKATAATQRCVLRMHWYDATRAEVGGSPTTVYDEGSANPTTWTERHARSVPPTGARYARLELRGADALSGSPSGKVWFDGVLVRTAPRRRVTTVTTDTTLAVTDHGTILADATGGAFTVTLPNPLGHPGIRFAIVRVDAAAHRPVQVAPPAPVTLDGAAASRPLRQPSDSLTLISDGVSGWRTVGVMAETPLPRGHIDGLILSNNAGNPNNAIDIAPGACRDGADATNMPCPTVLTKRLDAAWAEGTGLGGLDTGFKAAGSWYHLWIIRRSDTGVVDALFSLSAAAPLLPAAYDARRRVGAVRTDAASSIVAFRQTGDRFIWDVPVGDFSVSSTGTAAVLRALTVPPGLNVEAIFHIHSKNQTGFAMLGLVTSPGQPDTPPSATLANIACGEADANTMHGSSSLRVVTDTSGRVRTRFGTSDANLTVTATTFGWTDPRGSNA